MHLARIRQLLRNYMRGKKRVTSYEGWNSAVFPYANSCCYYFMTLLRAFPWWRSKLKLVISSTSLVNINVWQFRPTCALRTSEISSFVNKNVRYLPRFARNGGCAVYLPLFHRLFCPFPLSLLVSYSKFLVWSRWIEAERPVAIGSLFGIQFRETNRKICGCAGNRVRERKYAKSRSQRMHHASVVQWETHSAMISSRNVRRICNTIRFPFFVSISFQRGTRKSNRYPAKFPIARNSLHLSDSLLKRFNNRPEIDQQKDIWQKEFTFNRGNFVRRYEGAKLKYCISIIKVFNHATLRTRKRDNEFCPIVTLLSTQIGTFDASKMQYSKFLNRPSRDRCNSSSYIAGRCAQTHEGAFERRDRYRTPLIIDKRVRGRAIGENFTKLNAMISRTRCFRAKLEFPSYETRGTVLIHLLC